MSQNKKKQKHTVKHSSVQIISRSGTTTKTRKPQKLLESLVANPRWELPPHSLTSVTSYHKSLDMLVLTCLLTIYFSKVQFKLCNCQPPLTLLLLVEDPARRQTITSSHRPNTSSQIPYWSQYSEAHTSQSNKHNVTEQKETKTHTVKHSSVQIISRSRTTTKTRKPQKLLESLVANPRW